MSAVSALHPTEKETDLQIDSLPAVDDGRFSSETTPRTTRPSSALPTARTNESCPTVTRGGRQGAQDSSPSIDQEAKKGGGSGSEDSDEGDECVNPLLRLGPEHCISMPGVEVLLRSSIFLFFCFCCCQTTGGHHQPKLKDLDNARYFLEPRLHLNTFNRAKMKDPGGVNG